MGSGADRDDTEQRMSLILSGLELMLLGRTARGKSLYRLRYRVSHSETDDSLIVKLIFCFSKNICLIPWLFTISNFYDAPTYMLLTVSMALLETYEGIEDLTAVVM